MTFSLQSTLSAITAFGRKMGVTANNIANVETEGFKKSTATLVEGPKNNVEVEIEQPDIPGPVVVDGADGQLTEREMSNVDLAEEIPQTIVAQRGYEANLATLRTQDEMLKSIIDIIKVSNKCCLVLLPLHTRHYWHRHLLVPGGDIKKSVRNCFFLDVPVFHNHMAGRSVYFHFNGEI